MIGWKSLFFSFSIFLVTLTQTSFGDDSNDNPVENKRVILKGSENDDWKSRPSANIQIDEDAKLTIEEMEAVYPGFMPDSALKIHNKFFEGTNGKGPISCGYRNASAGDDIQVIQCSLPEKSGFYRVSCFSIIEAIPTEKNKFHFTSQGCWHQDIYSFTECEREKCVVKVQEGEPESGISFCCCTTEFCNKEVEIEYVPKEPSRAEKAKEYLIGRIVILVIAALIVTAVLILAVVGVRHLIKQKKREVRTPDAEQLVMRKRTSRDSVAEAIASLKKDENLDLAVHEQIGKGSFGNVFKGTLTSGIERIEVAVKVVNISAAESFINEKQCLQFRFQFPHEGILKFLNYDIRESELFMVTEYLPLGSLKDYLQENTLSLDQCYYLITSALDACTYMHEECLKNGEYKPTIVHRDIKSSNILLKEVNGRLQSIISDFGFSVICSSSDITESGRGQVGTRRYMAPELLEGATEFTVSAYRKIDVYALALVIWEILSRTNTDDFICEDRFWLAYEKDLGVQPALGDLRDLIVHKKFRPAVRNDLYRNPITAEIARSVHEMWAHEPESRISAGCMWERTRIAAIKAGFDSDPLNSNWQLIARSRGLYDDANVRSDNVLSSVDNPENS